MKSREVGKFTVVSSELNKPGISQIYFTFQEYGKSRYDSGQALYDVLNKQFIECRNRVGAAWEFAIKEAFEL